MYEYYCNKCTHEFNYEDGVKDSIICGKWIECPMCHSSNLTDRCVQKELVTLVNQDN